MSDKKKHHGHIKFFSFKRGYGFIVPEGSSPSEEVFFHFSSISTQANMVVYLIPDEKVEFELVKGPRGFLAKNVSSNNRVRDRNFEKKVDNIYYHYYHSFRKIVDGMIANEIDKSNEEEK
ncbi:hypothetical protein GVAV_002608 [Gurleya vavrai]